MPKIKYKLYPNHLKDEPGHYRAVMSANETLDLKDVIDFMSFRHSSITTADMFAFIEDFNRSVVRMLLDGKRINTDLATYSLSIRGNFTSADDQFDPNRHELVIQIQPGRPFQETVQREASFEKQRAVEPRPTLNQYTNMHNGDPDTVLSPTHTARIKGYNLNFDPADPEQGVFLVPANGNGAITNGDVRVEEISLATSGQVIFRVPDGLPAGPYKLEVRARLNAAEVRSGIFKDTLQVQ